MGVWIETNVMGLHGLKNKVTPFVGVWIETPPVEEPLLNLGCHTLRGCVD